MQDWVLMEQFEFHLIFQNRLSLLRHFKSKIMIEQILMFGQIANRVIP